MAESDLPESRSAAASGQQAGAHAEQGRNADDNAPKKPSPLKRRGVRIALLAVALVAIAGGIFWLIHHETVGKYIQGTDDAYIDADMVTVAPKVGGYVEAVLVSSNQEVKAGQPLVKIDPRDYQAQVAQFQAQIDIAKANADALRAGIGEQQSAINEARARLAAAQANAAYALAEEKRYAPLARIGAETNETLSAKRNQAKQAGDQAAMARAALASAEKRIASLHAQIRQAEAQGETASAQLAAAKVSLESAVVTSSIAGRIGDLTVRVGQFVQPGTRMMSVVPVDRLYLTANFKETQIGLMRTGQPAEIKIDALSGIKLRGRVESIAPGTGAQFSLLPPQNATGNFTKIVQRVPVRIAIEASPEIRRVLVPGLSATVKVNTINAKNEKARMEDSQQQRNGDGL
ncbi:HlyD family secretion protein [Noviherbaspirillum pedocola]|uniref:HlyD family secretion protein n=1 Tax=Noviherbaspirillum pedocola TaxID=2801341 RepID=A0A934W803_9BURK|nr:HlyD family secretion protein [Noviherbaspirillum pedocola]MBK4738042.1 HlyD family secretion protein [Noviherbaspirillum pedocola]